MGAEPPLYLGVDVGTGSTKAVLADPNGAVVGSARRDHSTSVPRPGWAEHDADDVWWRQAAEVITEVTAGRAERVVAVGVSGIGPCVLVTDDAGRPLRPAILYGIDTRAVREINDLEIALGRDEIGSRCGSRLSTQAAGPKLLWLQRNEQDVWRDARLVFSASSFLVHRLTGEYVLDHHTASQFDPMYDLQDGAWISAWWDACAPGIRRPRLAWTDTVAGVVNPSAAERTGLRVGTPVAAGTVDAWAEAVSVNVRSPGDMMLMYGSTMFLIGITECAVRHAALWTTVGVAPGSTCLSGGMATSGALTTWFAGIAGDADVGELFDAAVAVPAGARGLLALPYFAGERTPVADPDARGVIAGLTVSHTRPDVFRALLEATAFGVRHNLEAFTESGAPIRRLVAVGGGTEGHLWPQIVSDVTGCEQCLPSVAIGAAYGDARLAAEAVGDLVAGENTWNATEQSIVATAHLGPLYDELYGAYRSLYTSTAPIVHLLARSGAAMVDRRGVRTELLELLAAADDAGVVSLAELGVDRARAMMRENCANYWGTVDVVTATTDHIAPSAGGHVPVRSYRPGAGILPAVIFLHGGGWVIGDIDTHDGFCRSLADEAAAVVFSVGYRLAPEHPFPAAAEDALAALRWVLDAADELGIDRSRVSICGDSAGGNLAAVTSRRGAAEGLALASQVLVYPVTDTATDTDSYVRNGADFSLSRDDMRWFLDHYLPPPIDRTAPDCAPLRADRQNLLGVAPAYVATCQFDPLRDEGEAYARALAAAGVAVEYEEWPGTIHGFILMRTITPVADALRRRIVEFLRAAWSASSDGRLNERV
ncbi:MAG: alpha/beta hydrolase fold domain-containing protein [Gemmatimonadaceae bacterium]|nr:alpha/beta hydrolase fold domain-containing protein [Gemmatimonadaceae bacterium]